MEEYRNLHEYVGYYAPTFTQVHVRTKLENYDKEIEADVFDNCLKSLENSKKLANKILLFCANVTEVNLSTDSDFRIFMTCDGVECYICVESYSIEVMQEDENGPREPEDFRSDQFDEFLESFSKTPFYKRPEFIKVAARCDSD